MVNQLTEGGVTLNPLQETQLIYIKIAQIIENDILNGRLAEGGQAPSMNQFAKIYSVNPATANKGLNILVEENILVKKRGIGMFVADGAKEKVYEKRRKKFLSQMLPELLKEARQLHIQKEELLTIIKQDMEEKKHGTDTM